MDVEGNLITFGYGPQQRVLRKQVDENRGVLEQIASELAGRPMTVRSAELEGAPEATPAATPQDDPRRQALPDARIDMSEFQERHSVARLIGAPPGYVGYEEGGHLTELVRRKPYSVILLDEVEKAHPDVFNVLLQVLDDGRMTDGQGRTVDFKNTVIVMTSNLGSHKIQQMTDAGDGEALIKIAVMAEVKANFRPEFVNRIDEIVVFHPLGEAQIAEIAKIQLKALEARLAKLEIRLAVSDAALKAVAAAGFDPVYGARPLKRAIQQQIENPLAKEMLAGKFAAGDAVKVGAAGGEITFAKG